jgi:hypothetical protein
MLHGFFGSKCFVSDVRVAITAHTNMTDNKAVRIYVEVAS